MPLNPLASWRFGRIRCHGGPFTLKRIFGSTSAMDFTSTATSHDNHLLDTNHSDEIDTEVYHMYHCMLGTCCAGYHCFDISGLKQSIRTFHARFCWDPAQDGGSLEDILPSDCRCCAVQDCDRDRCNYIMDDGDACPHMRNCCGGDCCTCDEEEEDENDERLS